MRTLTGTIPNEAFVNKVIHLLGLLDRSKVVGVRGWDDQIEFRVADHANLEMVADEIRSACATLGIDVPRFEPENVSVEVV